MKIVHLRAVDWGIQESQVSADYQMGIVTADIVGIVVHEDDEKIVVTQQLFMDGGRRYMLAVPQVCILEKRILEENGNQETGA